MRSGVPVQDLRGSDTTLLEVQVPDLWKLPLGQVHLLTVLDLMELASTEGCPKVLRAGLQSFMDRTTREIEDLPRGESFNAFVAELSAVDPERVPQVLRELLAAQAEERNHEGAKVLVDRVSDTEPLPFSIGVKKAKVQRAAMVTPKKKRAVDPSSAPSAKGEKASSSGATASTGAGRANPPARDLDRHLFLQQIAMERLAYTSDKGLMEAVLVAGICHIAKDEYSDVTPKQVKDALKGMKDDGRARYSAGRWMGTSRY